jgi:uncharacterized OB-fold protein
MSLLSDPDWKPFWEGCKREVLLIQRCAHCEHFRYPPSPICPSCLCPDHLWIEVSGKGTLFSFSVVQRALDPYWKGELPYLVGVIELAEGPRMLSNLVGTPMDQVCIGMAVNVVFEHITEEIVLPRFKAVAEK